MFPPWLEKVTNQKNNINRGGLCGTAHLFGPPVAGGRFHKLSRFWSEDSVVWSYVVLGNPVQKVSRSSPILSIDCGRPLAPTRCTCCWIPLMLKSHEKVLRMDLLWRLKEANFHRARPIEDSERWCSVHAPRGDKHPLLCQIVVLSIVAPPAHPIRHKSELHSYHPQEENRHAPHSLSQASEMHWNHKYSDSWKMQSQTSRARKLMTECCIVHRNLNHK